MKFIRPLSQTTLISNANLVSYWPLDGNANDYKNVNNGTSTAVIYGGQYAQFGQGGYFNGNSSYIDVGNNASLQLGAGPFTISAWFKKAANGTVGSIYHDNAGTSNYYSIGTNSNNTLFLYVAGNSGYTVLVSTTSTITDTNWHLLTCVIESSTSRKIYLDGVLNVTNTTNIVGSISSNRTKNIGRNTSNVEYFNGSIDDVSIFNRALTATEVAYLAAGETFINNRPLADTRFFTDANLMAYWKFDGNSNDSKGSYNGTDTAITYGTQYGIFGQGALFNGTSSKIVLPSIATNVNTFSCWFKKLNNATAYLYVQDNTDAPEARIYFVGNVLHLDYYSYGAYQAQITYTFTDTTSWHHIVGVWNTNDVRLYLDGVLIGSDTSATMQSATAVNHSIGWYTRSSTYYFNGYIDDAAVFSRALSTTEVQELYEKEVVRAIYRPLEQTRFRNDDSLVSYWKLDGNSTDSKGGFNGTDTAVTYVSGGFDRVASFNGASIISTTGINTQLSKDFTFSCWAKINTANLSALMSSNVISYANYFINLAIAQPSAGVYKVRIQKYDGTNNPYIDSVTTLSLGVWYHIAFIKSGSSLITYINGVYDTSTTDTTTSVPAYSGLTLGGQTSFSDRYFTGLIDDAAVFNRALSREEVAELYQSQTVGEIQPLNYKPQGGLYATSLINDANLVSYWKMDGNSRDSKGSNHGTDTAMTYSTSYGKFGQGASFNGTTSRISLSALVVSGSSSRTVSLWVYNKGTSTYASCAFYQGNYNIAWHNFGLYFNVNSANSIYFQNAGGDCYSAANVLSLNTWQHITVTYLGGNFDATTFFIYLNGVLVPLTFTGTPAPLATENINCSIGCRGQGNDLLFNGYIEDVTLFNRGLSSSEVFEIYSKGESSPFRPLDAVPALRQDSSLVSYWKLNGDATDSKGSNNGTATNVTYSVGVNGRFGQAGVFNGSSSYISYSSKVMPIGAKTVSFWFKTSYTGNYQQFYDDCNCGSAAGSTILTNITTGIIRFYSRDSVGGRYDVGTINNVCDGIWHHFTGTWDGTTNTGMVKLYIDGILVNTGTASSVETVAATYNSMIGRRNVDVMYYLNGSLDDIAIFNRALTGAEVYQIYTQGSTVGYWKLNGSSTDYSGNGNHGTDTAITYAQGNGVFNQGALFNGTTSIITKTSFVNMPLNGACQTYVFWLKPSNITFAAYMEFYAFGEAVNATGQRGLRFRMDSGGYLTLYYAYFGGFSTQTYANFFANNIYTNLIIVMDSTTYTIYKDGSLFASGTLTYPESVNVKTMILGGDSYQSRYFPGSIDEVIIENRPWSASEVRKYYTKSKRMFI